MKLDQFKPVPLEVFSCGLDDDGFSCKGNLLGGIGNGVCINGKCLSKCSQDKTCVGNFCHEISATTLNYLDP